MKFRFHHIEKFRINLKERYKIFRRYINQITKRAHRDHGKRGLYWRIRLQLTVHGGREQGTITAPGPSRGPTTRRRATEATVESIQIKFRLNIEDIWQGLACWRGVRFFYLLNSLFISWYVLHLFTIVGYLWQASKHLVVIQFLSS